MHSQGFYAQRSGARRLKAKVNWVRTWNTCNVLFGASIFFKQYTHTYKGLTFEGEITALDEPPWPEMIWDDSARQYRESDMDYYRSVFR